MKRVLIVEDEASVRGALAELFQGGGAEVHAAPDVRGAMALLVAHAFDFVVADLRLVDHRGGGLVVLGATGMLSPKATSVMLTAYPDADHRAAAERLGAAQFLPKPVDLAELAAIAAARGVPSALVPLP